MDAQHISIFNILYLFILRLLYAIWQTHYNYTVHIIEKAVKHINNCNNSHNNSKNISMIEMA